ATYVTGINNLRQMVGTADTQAFMRDSDGTYRIVDAGSGTSPAAINDLGQIAGTVGVAPMTTSGFIATPSGSTRPYIRSTAGVIPASAFAGASAIAAGGWIEIYGENLAAAARAWRTSDFAG